MDEYYGDEGASIYFKMPFVTYNYCNGKFTGANGFPVLAGNKPPMIPARREGEFVIS
jgi:hypothetical protein